MGSLLVSGKTFCYPSVYITGRDKRISPSATHLARSPSHPSEPKGALEAPLSIQGIQTNLLSRSVRSHAYPVRHNQSLLERDHPPRLSFLFPSLRLIGWVRPCLGEWARNRTTRGRGQSRMRHWWLRLACSIFLSLLTYLSRHCGLTSPKAVLQPTLLQRLIYPLPQIPCLVIVQYGFACLLSFVKKKSHLKSRAPYPAHQQ